jgi:ubiquinone/menaquinone biosynthesis C-methylase UbiE
LDPSEYKTMFSVEDTHWWYLGMAAVFKEVIRRWVPNKGLQILDAGCGTGASMQGWLSEFGSTTGMDISIVALKFCKLRSLNRLIQGSIDQIPIQSASFDMVTSFDVLYERSISDVLKAIIEINRILVPGGYFILRVPAYNWLHSRHDDRVNTARRFTIKGISELLLNGGFLIRHRSYVNAFLFPVALCKRMTEKWFPKSKTVSDFYVPGKLVNKILTAALKSEAYIASGVGFPYGLSIAVVAQKPL